MMNLMIDTAKKNLEVLTGMQQRNEEMVRVLLDHTAKTREQIVATNESLMKIATEQGTAATRYVEDNIKAGREIMERQVAEANKVMEKQVAEANKVMQHQANEVNKVMAGKN